MYTSKDMVNARRDRTNLSELKKICSIIDDECKRQGVDVEGIMTFEDARRCVRIGCRALNIPDKTEEEVMSMKWSSIYGFMRPDTNQEGGGK